MKIILWMLLFLQSISINAQVVTDSLLIEGHYRSFHFNKTEKKKNASLIFVLHGSGGTGLNMMAYGKKLDSLAVAENCVIVYANGYKKFWNECRKASTTEANTININEQLFFTKMIDYFYKKFGINKKQVFVIGFSGGGHMAFKLAQTIPHKLAGICTIVANLPTKNNNDCTVIKHRIPVLLINSTADSVSPYNGGKMNTSGVSLGTVQSVKATFEYWAKVNDSYTPPARMALVEYSDEGKTSTSTRYFQKPLKPTTMLISIIDGKHELPTLFNAFEVALGFFTSELKRSKY